MELPKRKPNRLKNYDYSQNGAYFITICTLNKKCLLWQVGATFGRPQVAPVLSHTGRIVDSEINKILKVYRNVCINKYVVMPNHIHMIILISNDEIGRPKVAPTISRIIKFKKCEIVLSGISN